MCYEGIWPAIPFATSFAAYGGPSEAGIVLRDATNRNAAAASEPAELPQVAAQLDRAAWLPAVNQRAPTTVEELGSVFGPLLSTCTTPQLWRFR